MAAIEINTVSRIAAIANPRDRIHVRKCTKPGESRSTAVKAVANGNKNIVKNKANTRLVAQIVAKLSAAKPEPNERRTISYHSEKNNLSNGRGARHTRTSRSDCFLITKASEAKRSPKAG